VGGLNLCRYVNGNPVHFPDPEGSIGSCGNTAAHSESGQDGIGEIIGASNDFARNYRNMRDAYTIGGDKYFHCIANCQASRQGAVGSKLFEAISEARELSDEYIKCDSSLACNDDRQANGSGRNGAQDKPDEGCSSICGSDRPEGLPSKY
jgi:hypothetical protein